MVWFLWRQQICRASICVQLYMLIKVKLKEAKESLSSCEDNDNAGRRLSNSLFFSQMALLFVVKLRLTTIH